MYKKNFWSFLLLLFPINVFGQMNVEVDDLIEDRLESERFFIEYVGNYQDVVKEIRNDIREYESKYDSTDITVGSVESVPVIYFTTSIQDSVENNMIIVVREDTETEPYMGMNFYLDYLRFINEEEFKKRYKVIED